MVKKMLVMMLGVSTPSASSSASAGRAERASDASMEEATKVVVVVVGVWGMLILAVVAVSRPTFDGEATAITFTFDVAAASTPPLNDAGVVVTRTTPGIACVGR